MSSHDPNATRPEPRADRGGGIPGFVIFIGVLLVVNLLSYLLDWPFWLY